MTFGKVMIWGAVQSVIRLAAGLATTKILSVFLGPAGLAVFAQFQTFAALLNNFVNGGIQQGIVKYTADFKDRPAQLLTLNRTVAALSLGIPALLALPLIVWRVPLAAWLFKAPGLEPAIVVYALMMFVTSIGTALCAQLNGLLLPTRVFAAQAIFGLLSFALVLVLTPHFGLMGALLSIPLAQLGLVVPVVFFARKVPGLGLAGWRPKVEPELARDLLRYGALLFVTSIALSGSQLYVRDLLIHVHSPDIAGHWQAVLRISEPFVIITTAVLTPYYLPRFSGAGRETYGQLMRHFFRIVLPGFALCAVLVVALREYVIVVMFTPAFLPASELFLMQFLGDTVRMVSWIATIALMAAGRTRSVMLSEVVFAGFFTVCATLLIPRHGAWAASAAYLLANIAACTVLWALILTRRRRENGPGNA